jgi:hypothetical protein
MGGKERPCRSVDTIIEAMTTTDGTPAIYAGEAAPRIRVKTVFELHGSPTMREPRS